MEERKYNWRLPQKGKARKIETELTGKERQLKKDKMIKKTEKINIRV